MKKFKALTEDEMFLISGGRRCTDNSRDRRGKREESGFERALREKREHYGRLGRASAALDGVNSALHGGGGC